MTRQVRVAFLSAAVAIQIVACGPSTYVQQRVEFENYSASEAKQTKSNITVERQKVTELPAEFHAQAGKCNVLTGEPLVDSMGRPRKQRTSLAPSAALIEKVSIENRTGHILRMGGAVIAMFDPADNQYDALDKDQIASLLTQEHKCAAASDFIDGLKLVKTVDRNTQVLPGRTVSGYLLFTPANKNMSGMWKLSLYEVPVKYDAAGNPVQTVQFDFNTQAKLCQDTYRRDSPVSPPVLVGTQCSQPQ